VAPAGGTSTASTETNVPLDAAFFCPVATILRVCAPSVRLLAAYSICWLTVLAE